MGRVNQLWQDERERFARELVDLGMSEEDAWEYATRSCDSGRHPEGEDPKGLSGEAMPERPAEERASPNPLSPSSPNQEDMA